ncbi:MAG: hypothetical protein RML95_14010 [Anaerolineae bacterium]|nr:hypothetical protein [Anaerolineae bacterium]
MSWIALWLVLLAPAMCQRHGLLYFHIVAPKSSPAQPEDFMCGDWSPSAQPSVAEQHHTEKAFQTSVLPVFATPELTLAVETAFCVTAVALDDETAEPFALVPLPPPPRFLHTEA